MLLCTFKVHGKEKNKIEVRDILKAGDFGPNDIKAINHIPVKNIHTLVMANGTVLKNHPTISTTRS